MFDWVFCYLTLLYMHDLKAVDAKLDWLNERHKGRKKQVRSHIDNDLREWQQQLVLFGLHVKISSCVMTLFV